MDFLDIKIFDHIETGKTVHIGPWKVDIAHLRHEFFLLNTLKHQGIVLPEKADGIQKLMLERSKELRIMLGFEKSDTESDDTKYIMGEQKKEELGFK